MQIFFSEIQECHFCQLLFLLVQCDDADADYEQICGFGGTGCTGVATDPTCQCNTAIAIVPASDGRSCVPGEKLVSFWVICGTDLGNV